MIDDRVKEKVLRECGETCNQSWVYDEMKAGVNYRWQAIIVNRRYARRFWLLSFSWCAFPWLMSQFGPA
jgi:hypothetical protein